MEFSSAEGDNDRLPELVGHLIRRSAAVIVANGTAALAVKAVSTTVPVIFVTGSDPVQEGLVASLHKPGANVTGVLFFASTLGTKRWELLRQLVPAATRIAILCNPNSLNTETELMEVQGAADAMGQHLVIVPVTSENDIEAAFQRVLADTAGALIVGSGALLNSNRDRIVALAARAGLPAIYSERQAAVAGGLVSYGTDQTDAYRQAGIYAGRILKGEKPSDLPVIRGTKFDLTINLRTAKSLGLTISPSLLARADEVIE
jgi:putative ABC transport system substrate-binding protein